MAFTQNWRDYNSMLPIDMASANKQHASQLAAQPEVVRIDIWLWAARFFKTRSLAKHAVEGGKIRVNAQPCKPAKAMHVGDLIQLAHGNEAWEVRVLALSSQRGNASIAQTLYAELPESTSKRLAAREAQRLQRLGYQAPITKPDKRARRQIHAFERVIAHEDQS
jgi:ribosome-associated heat shock protein Hsp15